MVLAGIFIYSFGQKLVWREKFDFAILVENLTLWFWWKNLFLILTSKFYLTRKFYLLKKLFFLDFGRKTWFCDFSWKTWFCDIKEKTGFCGLARKHNFIIFARKTILRFWRKNCFVVLIFKTPIFSSLIYVKTLFVLDYWTDYIHIV